MHGHGHVVAQHSTAIASDPSRLLRPTCVVRLLVNPLVCEATCCFAYNCVLASHDLCKLLACYATEGSTAKGGRRVDRSTYHSTAQNSSNCLHLVQTQLLSTYHVPRTTCLPFFRTTRDPSCAALLPSCVLRSHSKAISRAKDARSSV